MQKETMRRNVLDYRERLSRRRVVRRNLRLDYAFLKETGKVAAIVGPRRAGKSTFLLQIADDIGLPPDSRIHIDFSEIAWTEFDTHESDEWQRLYEVALEFDQEPVFFLDEIQELGDFGGGVRYLTNRGGLVFLTGSNAALFEQRLSTVLRGKVLVYRLFPLSFDEYLRFTDQSFTEPLSTADSVRRTRTLINFLTWGGFPEVVLADTEELKRSLLESYLDVMLFRDVVERHRVQNTVVLQRLLNKALVSFTKDVSVNRWYNDFRSQGLRVGKDTLYEYLGYLEEALFLFAVENAEKSGGTRKIYLIDNGLYQRVKDRPDMGKLLENQVFVDILRTGQKPRFLRDQQGEVDFITDRELLQVCAEVSGDNRDREERPLRTAVKRYGNRSARIITLDDYPDFVPS